MTMLQMAVQRIEESECGEYDLLDDEDLGYLSRDEEPETDDNSGWYY